MVLTNTGDARNIKRTSENVLMLLSRFGIGRATFIEVFLSVLVDRKGQPTATGGEEEISFDASAIAYRCT